MSNSPRNCPQLPFVCFDDDDEAVVHSTSGAADEDKKDQSKKSIVMHEGRLTRASFLGQVLLDGTEEGDVAQDKTTLRAMAKFSVLAGLFRTQPIDREELHRAFGKAVDPSVVVLTPPQITKGMEECDYEDLYQILCDAANSKFQITVIDMIWEAEGIFHFLIRIKNKYFDGNLRAMAYTNNKGKIVHVEAKKLNVSKDRVVENLKTFFGFFQRAEDVAATGKKRKVPMHFRESATALFDRFMVVENTAGEICFDDFYRQVRLLYRNGLRILSFDVIRHVMGVEWTMQSVYSPEMTTNQEPSRRRRFSISLSSPFSSPPNSPTNSPVSVSRVPALSAGSDRPRKPRLRIVRVLGQTRRGRIVRCSSVSDAHGHTFLELFFPQDMTASRAAISGQVVARNSARFSFVSMTEADMARCVQPLPYQLRSRVLGEGTQMMPAFLAGRVVKVTLERPFALGLPHMLFGLMRLPLMVHNTDGVGRGTPYAGGAYLTEEWVDGKCVLHQGGASNKPIAISRRVDQRTFDIDGRHALFPRDKAVSMEKRRFFYPWYRLESSDACEFKSYTISVWNGRNFHPIWKAHQKHKNTDWLPRKQYDLVVQSLSGDATLAFITNKISAVRGKLHSLGWQVTIAPGVDPALIICIAACL